MRRPRFRLRSLMILVLLAALAMGAGLEFSRMDPDEVLVMEQRFVRIMPVLVLVLAKLGLITWARLGRSADEVASEPRPVDERGRDEILP